MTRFYQSLLGKRAGLSKPVPKAEALQEAKQENQALPCTCAGAFVVAWGVVQTR